MTAQIAYTQPYVPKYRVPLFDELARLLEERDAHLTVYSGCPTGEQAGRNDQANGVWQTPIRAKSVPVARRSVEWREMPRALKRADLVVSELSALNLIGWRRAVGSRPLVLWGHGKSYVNDGSWLSDRLEWALARRADHIMTYVSSGAQYLIDSGGIPARKVTAVGNSTDTLTLRRELLAAQKLTDWTSDGPTALYVGALDSTKRLDIVLGAFDHAVHQDPAFRLIVAGQGPMAKHIDEVAAGDPRIVRYGDARGGELAKLAVQSDAIWMPGRVGLVAVDALALGLPVHTTEYAYHAPEIEMLGLGEVEYLPADPAEFARASLRAIARARPTLRQDFPSVQTVASAMVAVIGTVLSW